MHVVVNSTAVRYFFNFNLINKNNLRGSFAKEKL